jgi:prolyl oligopeptidase
LFTVLLAYSPYAWHAKKMTARLQDATTSDRPVLLRLESTGHLGGSLDRSIDETTDRHAFLFDQLGLGYPPLNGA